MEIWYIGVVKYFLIVLDVQEETVAYLPVLYRSLHTLDRVVKKTPPLKIL